MNFHDYNPQAVKAARKAAGYKTQEEVARLLKVHIMTVGRVEAGTAASYELLKSMATLYGVSHLQWLCDTPIFASKNTTSNVK